MWLKPAITQAAEAAQKVLPIEIPNESGAFEVLTVMVHRCTGLDKLRRGLLQGQKKIAKLRWTRTQFLPPRFISFLSWLIP